MLNQNKNIKQEKEKVDNLIEEIKKENLNLKNSLNIKMKNESNKNDLKNKIIELKSQLNIFASHNELLTKENVNMKKSIETNKKEKLEIQKNELNITITNNKNKENSNEKINKVIELQKLNEELEKEKKELNNQILTSNNKIQEMKIKINELENEIKFLKNQKINSPKKENISQVNNLTEPSKNEIILIEKNKELIQINQVLENKLLKLQFELNNLTNKNNKLKNQFSKEKKLSEESDKIKIRNFSSDHCLNRLQKFKKTHQQQLEEKINEINDLNQEIFGLKKQIEKNEENNNIIVLKEKEILSKSEENELKIRFFEERKSYYENNLNELKEKNKNLENNNKELKNKLEKYEEDKKIEINIIQGEYELIKKELDKLKNEKQNLDNNNINENYSPETHTIICDKNYNNLQWFLLAPKQTNLQTLNKYDNLFWIEKIKMKNLEKYNKFISEMDEENQRIKNTIAKLEEKDNIINNLNIQLNNLNKIRNTNSIPEGETSFKSEINKKNKIVFQKNSSFDLNGISILNKENTNNTMINEGIPIEKFNLVLNKLNDSERRNQKLQQDNLRLLKNINEKNKSEFIDEEIQKGGLNEKGKNNNDKNLLLSERIEYKKHDDDLNFNQEFINYQNHLNLLKNLYRELENKVQKIKEIIRNLFSNIIFKTNEIEIAKNILLILDFKNEEIIQILQSNKK